MLGVILVIYKNLPKVPKLFSTYCKQVQISEQSSEKFGMGMDVAAEGQGHQNMMQEVQKISSKLFLISITCAALVYEMIKLCGIY